MAQGIVINVLVFCVLGLRCMSNSARKWDPTVRYSETSQVALMTAELTILYDSI
jgi:hypothetical protein